MPQEVWRCAAGVASKEVWRSGALEACCTCRDVEVFASRALEMRCRRVDVDILEVWRSGGLEACGACSDVEEAQRFGPLEMRCRRVDVEM